MLASGSSAEPVNGWVLYDGECGFCSRWLQLPETLAKHGFHRPPCRNLGWQSALRYRPTNYCTIFACSLAMAKWLPELMSIYT